MAFIAGIIGSGHCVGMCGGLALLPTATATGPAGRKIPTLLVFNGFRVISYMLLGALVGATGAAIGQLLDVTWWSLVLRVATGAVMVLIGLLLLLGDPRFALAERFGGRLWRRIAPLATSLNSRSGAWRLPGLGLMWGLLPCGLVYSMLLAASVSGSSIQGAALMLAFGLGTAPSMVGMGLLGQAGGSRLGGQRVKRLAGAVLILGGLWLAAWPVWHAVSPASGGHAHHAGMRHPG